MSELDRREINELRECVKENTRALRGHNGEPGMIAEVKEVSKDVKTILENHLPHITEQVSEVKEDVRTEVQTQFVILEAKILAAIEKKLDERTKNIFKDWIAPIAFPVITTIVLIWLGLKN